MRREIFVSALDPRTSTGTSVLPLYKLRTCEDERMFPSHDLAVQPRGLYRSQTWCSRTRREPLSSPGRGRQYRHPKRHSSIHNAALADHPPSPFSSLQVDLNCRLHPSVSLIDQADDLRTVNQPKLWQRYQRCLMIRNFFSFCGLSACQAFSARQPTMCAARKPVKPVGFDMRQYGHAHPRDKLIYPVLTSGARGKMIDDFNCRSQRQLVE